jgi:hypothetical protein
MTIFPIFGSPFGCPTASTVEVPLTHHLFSMARSALRSLVRASQSGEQALRLHRPENRSAAFDGSFSPLLGRTSQPEIRARGETREHKSFL